MKLQKLSRELSFINPFILPLHQKPLPLDHLPATPYDLTESFNLIMNQHIRQHYKTAFDWESGQLVKTGPLRELQAVCYNAYFEVNCTQEPPYKLIWLELKGHLLTHLKLDVSSMLIGKTSPPIVLP